MRRNKKDTVPALAILLSDMHLREDTPICRMDDYWAAMERKLAFLRDLQDRHGGIPVVHGGDLFEHWKPSPYLLSFAIDNLPRPFWSVYGNHDMPQHSMEQIGRSGMRTLEAAGALQVLTGVHWGQEPERGHGVEFERPVKYGPPAKLLTWHVMTYEGNLPYPGCTASPAGRLLRKHDYVDLILVGHNHVPFLVEDKAGRKMLNPGSMMRVKADQQDHEPSVYLWRADNTLERVVLPHDKGVVTREHIEAKAADDPRRYQAFLEQLQHNAPELSFRANLERFLAASNTSRKVKDIIWQSLEEV